MDTPSLTPASATHSVLVTGGTGYLGRALIPALLARGHRVRALVRERAAPLASAVERVVGNALVATDVQRALAGCDTLVHLVGVPKPSPAKARQFEAIDWVSIQASVAAAQACTPPPHVVYLSVAQPAPVMKAYVAVRARGEARLREAGLHATCLRPWYVLGPGHRWPYVLLPVYALLRRLPATRAGAERLDFVTLRQMTGALVHAVENPASIGIQILDAAAIKRCDHAR